MIDLFTLQASDLYDHGFKLWVDLSVNQVKALYICICKYII